MDSPGNVSVKNCPPENSPGKLTVGDSNGSTRQTSPKPSPGGGRPRPPRPTKPPIAQKPALPVKPTLSPSKPSPNDSSKSGPPPLPVTPPRGNIKVSPAIKASPKRTPKLLPKSISKSDGSPNHKGQEVPTNESSKVATKSTPNGKVCSGDSASKGDNSKVELKVTSQAPVVKFQKKVQRLKTCSKETVIDFPSESSQVKGQQESVESGVQQVKGHFDDSAANVKGQQNSALSEENVPEISYENENKSGQSAIEASLFFTHSEHLYSEIPETITPRSKSRQKNISRESDDQIIKNNVETDLEIVHKRLKSPSIEDIESKLPSRPVPKVRNSLGKLRQESDSELSSDSSYLTDMMTCRNEVPDIVVKSPSTSVMESNTSTSLSLTSQDTASFETSVSSTDNLSIFDKTDCLQTSSAQKENNEEKEAELPQKAQNSPEETCDMLKEIEALLNKKLADAELLDQMSECKLDTDEYSEPPLEDVEELDKEDKSKQVVPRRHSMDPTSFEKNKMDRSQSRYSMSSTPIRPPRPKRAASKVLRHIDLESFSGGSTESLDSNCSDAGSRKKCPPKPKRTTLPRVGRSQSDVTGMQSLVDEKTKPPPVPKRPVFPTPDKPPPLPPRNKPQNPPDTMSMPSSEDATKVNGQAGLIKSALGSTSQPQISDCKPSPARKAPPPPENPPSLSRLKNHPSKSKLVKQKSTTESPKSDNTRKLSNQESKGFLVTDIDLFSTSDSVEQDLDMTVPVHNVSRVSSDHDYHEIPDSLVRDEPPSPISRDKSPPCHEAEPKSKETMPPPQLPPRNYRESLKDLIKDSVDQSSESSGSIKSSNPSIDQSCEIERTEDGYSKTVKHNKSGSSTPKSDKSRPVSGVSGQSSYSESGSIENNQNDSSASESEEDEEAMDAKRSRKAFLTAKEIMTSEMVFVDVLKLLNVDFRVAMSKATEQSDKPVISNEVLNKILDFLPQLQNFNEDLLRDLNERIQKWDEHQKVADIFVKKGPFLKMYSSYIKNFKNSTSILDDNIKKNPAFAAAVRQFESSPRCASLALKHHMLKPIQRIPQYRLLLQDYLKHLKTDSPDYQNTINALTIVSKVADHADQSTRQGDDVQKLMEIQNALIGQFEVIQPGRELIKCGELMKLSRKELQPRMFFLFNDVLLYTVSVASGYKLNQILPVSGMKVSKPLAEDFKNEFSILSVQRSFTVAASTPEERDDWLKILSQVIEEAALRKNTFQTVKLHATPQVVCGNCSENKAPLRYLKYKSARVCSECYIKIESEIDRGEIDTKCDESDLTSSTPVSLTNLKARFEKIRKSARSNKGAIKRPAVLKEVHANDEGSDMSGYLKNYKNKKWKKMWYVLKDKVLYTYRASEDMAAVESLPLLGYEVARAAAYFEGAEPDLVFHLIHPNTPPHIFRTDSAAATSRWINVMREASVP